METHVRKFLIALALAAGASFAAHVAPAQVTKPAAAAPEAAQVAAPAAAPVCLNLAEADCGAASGCVWLPGYEVAGGQKVAGYCRPAPKPLTARRRPTVESEQPK